MDVAADRWVAAPASGPAPSFAAQPYFSAKPYLSPKAVTIRGGSASITGRNRPARTLSARVAAPQKAGVISDATKVHISRAGWPDVGCGGAKWGKGSGCAVRRGDWLPAVLERMAYVGGLKGIAWQGRPKGRKRRRHLLVRD